MKYTNPDLPNSALVNIDEQRDFSLPGSPAEVPGTMDVVPHIVRMLNASRASGRPCVHMADICLTSGLDYCAAQTAAQLAVPISRKKLFKLTQVESACSQAVRQ
jgi:hypothetical protein